MTRLIHRRAALAGSLGLAGGLGLAASRAVAEGQGPDEPDRGHRNGGPVARLLARAVSRDGKFSLPLLTYPYDALEPAIDAETMQLHHGRHHAAYVKGANDAIEGLAAIRKGKADQAAASDLTDKLSFNLSGHLLHTIFWATMTSRGARPSGAIARDIQDQFGSLDNFRDHFSSAASQVQGNGWGVLVFDPISRRLQILQARNHQLTVAWNAVPLLLIDVWEHAYYLKYKNIRSDYVKAFWGLIDWSAVDRWYGFVSHTQAPGPGVGNV